MGDRWNEGENGHETTMIVSAMVATSKIFLASSTDSSEAVVTSDSQVTSSTDSSEAVVTSDSQVTSSTYSSETVVEKSDSTTSPLGQVERSKEVLSNRITNRIVIQSEFSDQRTR